MIKPVYYNSIVIPSGIVVVDSDMVTCDINIRDDVKIVEVPCYTLANEINHPKDINIIMAEVTAKVTGDPTEEGLNDMNDMFRKKVKEKNIFKSQLIFKALGIPRALKLVFFIFLIFYIYTFFNIFCNFISMGLKFIYTLP